MLSGSVVISDAVFLELVDALNQYEEEEEEGGHEAAEGKQDVGKEELPVTRKRKRLSIESKSFTRPPPSMVRYDPAIISQILLLLGSGGMYC